MIQDNKPFIYDVPAQTRDRMAAVKGTCMSRDALKSEFDNALLTRMFSLGAFTAAQSSGELTIAAGSSIDLFVAGVGQSGTNQGLRGNMTASDTNAYDDGALCADDWHAELLGVEFSFEDPWQDNSTAGQELYRSTPDALVTGYRESLQRRLASSVSVELDRGTGTQNYKLGTIGDWPSMSGMVSSGTFAQIGSPIVNAFAPFDSSVLTSAKNTGRKAKLVLTCDHRIVIPTRADAISGAVKVPVKARFIANIFPASK